MPTAGKKLHGLVVCALLLGALEACGSEEEPTAQDQNPAKDDSSANANDDDAADESDDDAPKSAPDAKVSVPQLDAGGSVVTDAGAPSVQADAAVSDAGSAITVKTVPAPPAYAIVVPPSEQPKGDVTKGYDFLVNGDYQTLGFPWAGYSATMSKLEPRDSLPNRTGDNAKVSYQINVVTDADGVKVAAGNCLQCHSYHLNGKLIVGLGNAAPAGGYQSSGTSSDIPGILLRSSPEEAAVALLFMQRGAQSIRYGAMDVFPELASHHDPKTLEWNEQNLYDADTKLVGDVDVPPWWRCKKKNGLYAIGVGRGVQGQHMSFMSVFSVRNLEEGRHIFKNFIDVGEYIRSIEPPKYPGKIDPDLAAKGEQVYLKTCAMCHGTYGADWTYPNVIIPHKEVGTDPSLATDNWVNQATVDWFKDSAYAGPNHESWMELVQGYYAPPLDGVWATAPFFHNRSVPTLDGVIDPKKRPANWSSGFGDNDYDLERVGWKLSSLPTGLGGVDTSAAGNSNAGHTYGAALADEDKKSLLEYLKTL